MTSVLRMDNFHCWNWKWSSTSTSSLGTSGTKYVKLPAGSPSLLFIYLQKQYVAMHIISRHLTHSTTSVKVVMHCRSTAQLMY